MAIRTTESYLHYGIHKVAYHVERFVWRMYLNKRKAEYRKSR